MKKHRQCFFHSSDLRDKMAVNSWFYTGIRFFGEIDNKLSTGLRPKLLNSLDTGVRYQLTNYRDMDYDFS